jgi:hypothetical protein
VDPFLPPKDPRQFKEGREFCNCLCPVTKFPSDITDRFDHTFLFGDLNFRLKISRLHADWLMAHEGWLRYLMVYACSTDSKPSQSMHKR